MLYRIPAADATAPATTVTGRSIAHAHRSNPELALVGAGLHLNRLALTSPTIKQCASLVGVCTAYVRAAADIIDDPTACNAALHGDLNIWDAARRSTARESLADHIARSSPIELAAAAKEAGVDLVWDAMMMPNL